jgi:hypothetical protein
MSALLDLPGLIQRAMALFDAGDVLAAQRLASGVYDLAKTGARLAEGEALVRKAHRLQGDALLIECRAKVRIADEYDAAQASGAALKGRRKNADKESVPGVNTSFTLEEAGLDRKQIFEARQWRDLERREPGIAERAIEARLAQGLEPSRAAVRGIGTRSASAEEKGDQLYETPPCGIHALLALERFAPRVLGPSCGRGGVAQPMGAAGYDVLASDLNDYGFVSEHGVVQEVRDFFQSDAAWAAALGYAQPDIVENPPYGDVLNAWVRHALLAHRPRKMALLMNLNVLCGTDDPDRTFFMEVWPPARILINARRLPMMHRDGWDGNKASSSMNTAWFIWERSRKASPEQCQGTSAPLHPANEINTPKCAWSEIYGTRTLLKRVDWKRLEGMTALPPLGSVPASSNRGPSASEAPLKDGTDD